LTQWFRGFFRFSGFYLPASSRRYFFGSANKLRFTANKLFIPQTTSRIPQIKPGFRKQTSVLRKQRPKRIKKSPEPPSALGIFTVFRLNGLYFVSMLERVCCKLRYR